MDKLTWTDRKKRDDKDKTGKKNAHRMKQQWEWWTKKGVGAGGKRN